MRSFRLSHQIDTETAAQVATAATNALMVPTQR